jgi:carbonic anhydrase/acetyltransferase-like protein (isoleucine patch superfamily)
MRRHAMIRSFNGMSPKIAPSAFVSEAAYVIGDVEIGENSSVWPGAVIRGDICKIVIGDRSSVEDNCVVHGATRITIDNNVIIGHGAVVHCQKIGSNVLIGNNVTLLDGAEIGDSCIVGAGALVLSETKVPENSVVMGAPAQVKERVTKKQRDEIKQGSAFYAELAQRYLEQGF